MRNSAPEAGPTIWPTSTLRARISPAVGAVTLRLADFGPGRPELCLGDPHLRIGRVTNGLLGIDLGLGDEAAALERNARARSSIGQARHWRAPPRPARRAAPPVAPGPIGRRPRAPGRRGPSFRHRREPGRPGRPDPAIPTGWSRLAAERAAGGDHAADLATAGYDHGDRWDLARAACARRANPFRCAAAEDHQDRTRSAAPTAAAMISQRRRCERSTTISVSEEWIEVSRFIIPCPISQILQLATQAVLANKSPHATDAVAGCMPAVFDKRRHLCRKRALARRQ